MPYVMVTPYPIKFERRGNDIAVRFEEFDILRIIHMEEDHVPESESFSPQGYSIGRWEGNSLVVETAHIDSLHFYGDGTPQSRAMKTYEKFTLSQDETRLDYELVADDSEIFLVPVELGRYWAWKPEIALEPFPCER